MKREKWKQLLIATQQEMKRLGYRSQSKSQHRRRLVAMANSAIRWAANVQNYIENYDRRFRTTNAPEKTLRQNIRNSMTNWQSTQMMKACGGNTAKLSNEQLQHFADLPYQPGYAKYNRGVA